MIIEQCVREKLPLPKRIQNAPELLLGNELFYVAFLDLTSCRGEAYESEGPIRWTATQKWAEVHEMDEEQREDLHYYIPRMDKTYLDFKAKKLKDANGANG